MPAPPVCSDPSVTCDTGDLVRGRSSVGREPNASNTIHGSCEDGASIPSGSPPSVDRIVVAAADGGPFVPGAAVRIEAAVSSSDSSTDVVDFYYAADAGTPDWVLVGAVTPSVEIRPVATFELSTGAEAQAVRVQYRRPDTSGSCAAGEFNDRDDLVFTVARAR